MAERHLRRFVAALLRGRRPTRFRVSEEEADQLRAAITLRAARPGAGAPREEFVTDLHRRLAAQAAADPASAGDPPPAPAADPAPMGQPPGVSRRRLVASSGIAAGVAGVLGVGADRLALGAAARDQRTVEPNIGQWHTVAASAELPEGAAARFDVGSVLGVVARQDGQLTAVSGMCTHLGCRLAVNAEARRLDCPCHNTSFGFGGQLLRHQLREAPAALPTLRVREAAGLIQVFAPPAV